MTMSAVRHTSLLPQTRREVRRKESKRGGGVADSGTHGPPMPMPSASDASGAWDGLGRLGRRCVGLAGSRLGRARLRLALAEVARDRLPEALEVSALELLGAERRADH